MFSNPLNVDPSLVSLLKDLRLHVVDFVDFVVSSQLVFNLILSPWNRATITPWSNPSQVLHRVLHDYRCGLAFRGVSSYHGDGVKEGVLLCDGGGNAAGDGGRRDGVGERRDGVRRWLAALFHGDGGYGVLDVFVDRSDLHDGVADDERGRVKHCFGQVSGGGSLVLGLGRVDQKPDPTRRMPIPIYRDDFDWIKAVSTVMYGQGRPQYLCLLGLSPR
ncbi:hypothetical protein F3Y22_tig00000778pilonHSYRG00111 [Hibiscus syriacus]|uniref:Uncharacterized protein n=1 Tax=Hibiscus syriacus TaxID=106335 RepID=A0A6A3D2P0_HIBSY|nr:hypothetical protein F3Y22_tig00000778pilonHSYRG00111 [Hibiscus syriacus]